jgi:hypothetical protein
MSKKAYRTYTQEFKLEALELLRSSGKSAAQIERELGITQGMLMKNLSISYLSRSILSALCVGLDWLLRMQSYLHKGCFYTEN